MRWILSRVEAPPSITAINKAKLARPAELALNDQVKARKYELLVYTLLMDAFYSDTPDPFYAKTA